MAPVSRTLLTRLTGGALALAGVAGLATLIVVTYSDAAVCRTWALRLGLSASLLASALAQILVLLGSWLLWRPRADME